MGWYATFDEEHDMLYFDETEKNRNQMRIDRDIYFFLKRFINRESSKAGDKGHISWDFIATSIKEDRRSGYIGDTLANKTPNERKNYLKSCARRMEKKGWIKVNSTARQLVIFFNVFHDCYQHYFVQKKDYPLSTPPLVSTNETDKPHKDGGYSDFSADAAPQDYSRDSAQDYPIPEDSIYPTFTNNNDTPKDISNDHANVDDDYLQYEKFMQEEETRVTPATPATTQPAFASKSNPITIKQDTLVSFFVERLGMKIGAVLKPDVLTLFEQWRKTANDSFIISRVLQAEQLSTEKIYSPKYFNHLFQETNTKGYSHASSQRTNEQSRQSRTASHSASRRATYRKPDWQSVYESATGESIDWA